MNLFGMELNPTLYALLVTLLIGIQAIVLHLLFGRLVRKLSRFLEKQKKDS